MLKTKKEKKQEQNAPQAQRQSVRVRDWKGLMKDESRRSKLLVLLSLSLMSASISFVQLGFLYLGIGFGDNSFAYGMTLLAPIAAAALLLGKGWGTAQGAFSGLMLFLHSMIQPLDLYEKYLVSFIDSVILYALVGFVLGLLFAVALRNDPRGIRRAIYIILVCAIVSILATISFTLFGVTHLLISELMRSPIISGGEYGGSSSFMMALAGMGSLSIQMLFDGALMSIFALLSSFMLDRYRRSKDGVGIAATFSTWLLAVVSVSFMVLLAVSFVAITMEDERDASAELKDEVDYIAGLVDKAAQYNDKLSKNEEISHLSSEAANLAFAAQDLQAIVDGYDLDSDGTVVVFHGDEVICSDSPAYKPGNKVEDLFGASDKDFLARLSRSNEMSQMIYNTHPIDTEEFENVSRDIGYVMVKKTGDYYVMMARPASMVFSERHTTVVWITISVFALLVAVHLLASRLVNSIMVKPINETNSSLGRITEGQLEERVEARGTLEFASLSDGINTTVDALKGWIGEAERRMERDLATAKAIQESALPRTFPPFPEIKAFDIYASMNAAKEVGGDFYDFFLIDDHTLGFLIADVSGKGIPGALFMMTAKTELENYMETGMELDQAIAGVNARLCANNDAGMFVTVWAATLDYNTGLLTYVNAGHNFPLLRHNGAWEWLNIKCGLFLGAFDTAKFKRKTLLLEPGDQLILYTDGVNEAFNVNEEEYGNDRLEGFLAAHAELGPRELVGELRADVAEWAKGAEQSDDITMLCLEFGVAPEVYDAMTYVATIDNVECAIEFVNAELNRRLCPPNVLNKIDIALEELLVNVCNYAYVDREEPGDVQISYIYLADPQSITIQISDQGIPFDPLTRKDPKKPASIQDMGIGGLGIYMVKKSMDDFSYVYDEQEMSNKVVIKKTW